MERVNRPVQRLVVVALALVLLVPVGAIGVSQLLGSGGTQQPAETAENPDDRPTVDPAEQPPRPELPRPEEPAAMTEQSAEGAQATLTYLLESYDYMMSSGDTSVWEDSVDPNCQACVGFLQNTEVLAAQGGYLVGGAFEVTGTSFSGTGEPPATGTAVADFTQEESILVDDPSLQAVPLEAESGQMIATLAWDGERWRATDLSIVPAGAGASDAGGAGG
ncbi:hypothetical protein DXU92_03100 [Brachybacterium saurashtrense]|uniref:DUF6318 domain-containing protein n=1 Tax=Brachybacterium saurashtrense TaxID=556288 RepID=A0A345YQE1_9MICO|nr:hypothetical protein DWV08_11350 [Brachybacterium saurashtrense]RRR23883.1 hypothetical protein DXU92_03100 [Brachybacterium saurashtrense]